MKPVNPIVVAAWVSGAALVLADPAPAQATDGQTVASKAEARRVAGRAAIEAQLSAIWPLGDECVADGDVVGCSSDLFVGLGLGGFYAPLDWLSVGGAGTFSLRPGVTGTASSDGQQTEVRRQFWRAGAQARLHPLVFERVMPWAGLELGFATVRTISETSGSTTGGNGTSTDSRTALAFDGGAGIDVWVHDRVSLTLQGWLLHIDLDRDQASISSGQPYYTSPFWVSLGFGARVWF